MKTYSFVCKSLAGAVALLCASPSLGLAANPNMQKSTYFDPAQLASHSLTHHPVSEYRHRLTVNSLAQGFKQPSVALLNVVDGPGQQPVLSQLLQKLSASRLGINPAQVREERSEQHHTLYGIGWKLKVYGDGSRVQFRNYRYLDQREAQLGKIPRLQPERLIALGQKFIDDVLDAQIRLSPNEELVPLGVQYQVNAEQAATGSARPTQTIVAGAAIFSRKINGIDVVGKGSKVAVLFANDEAPIGFDLDWPILVDSGAKQEVLSVAAIQQRTLAVARLPEQASAVRLERFECGYYDPGQRKRSVTVPLQSACFHTYSGRVAAMAKNGEAGYLTQAYVDVVPAGVQVIPDQHWDSALRFSGSPQTPEDNTPEPR